MSSKTLGYFKIHLKQLILVYSCEYSIQLNKTPCETLLQSTDFRETIINKKDSRKTLSSGGNTCRQLFHAIRENSIIKQYKMCWSNRKNWKDIMQPGKGHLKNNHKIIWYHFYVKSKKNDANVLIYKTETDWQRKQIYGYQRGRYGGDKLGVWD